MSTTLGSRAWGELGGREEMATVTSKQAYSLGAQFSLK